MTDRDIRSSTEPVSGLFWLPGSANVVVHRQLTLGAEGPILSLDGSLTPALKLEGGNTSAENSGNHSYVGTDWEDEPSLTVHGNLGPGERGSVTLAECLTTGRELNWAGWKVGPGVGKQRLRARYAMLGGHIDGSEEVFTEVRMRFRYIDEWANLGGFASSLDVDRASITFQRPNMPSAPLSGGGMLHVDQDVAWAQVGDGEKLTRSVWLRVECHRPTVWRDIDRGIVTPLSTLLTLGVDAASPPVAIELATTRGAGWLSRFSAGLQPPAQQQRSAADMLLPLPALSLTAVATWLDRVEDLGPLPPVVAAAAAKPRLNLETGVLELTTVAEGLARRLWPEWNRFSLAECDRARKSAVDAVSDREEPVRAAVEGALKHLHEPSYPERLEKLAEYAGDAVPGVLGRLTQQGRPSRWKRAAAEARNDFAHRFDRGWINEGNVDQYLAIYSSLRWLLTGVLLLQSGLEPETLACRLRQHQPYNLFLQQARQWLPKVYDGR